MPLAYGTNLSTAFAARIPCTRRIPRTLIDVRWAIPDVYHLPIQKSGPAERPLLADSVEKVDHGFHDRKVRA
ncbi:hypothetical protein D9M71_211590 [compost metagenome]|jgi:hypothetical protein